MADVWSSLTTLWSVSSDSSPRPGGSLWYTLIDGIGHHHTAGTSRAVCLALFQPGGRTVTPNYLIDGYDIIGIVPENRRPWTSSDAIADGRSILYEILNETASPFWRFKPGTIETVKRLDADVVRRYPKIPFRHALPGFWEHRNLNEWFGRSYATACAGPSFNINDVIAGAKAYYDAGGQTPEGVDVVKYLVFQNPVDYRVRPDFQRFPWQQSPREDNIAQGTGDGIFDVIINMYLRDFHEDAQVQGKLVVVNAKTGAISSDHLFTVNGHTLGTVEAAIPLSFNVPGGSYVYAEFRKSAGAVDPLLDLWAATVTVLRATA